MPKLDVPAVERIIANTINETARGDPQALAAHIVSALGKAGYRILPANGMENGTVTTARKNGRGHSAPRVLPQSQGD